MPTDPPAKPLPEHPPPPPPGSPPPDPVELPPDDEPAEPRRHSRPSVTPARIPDVHDMTIIQDSRRRPAPRGQRGQHGLANAVIRDLTIIGS